MYIAFKEEVLIASYAFGDRFYKLFLPISLFVLFVMLFFSVIFLNSQVKQDVNDAIFSDMTQALVVGEQQVNTELDGYRKDLFFLQDSSAVQLFEQNYTNNSDAAALGDGSMLARRVQQTFTALMKQEPAVYQVRLIDISSGIETVKVERTEDGFVDVSPNQLQDKSGRDYFELSKVLHGEEFYISSITLNREFGEIELPVTPTIRLAMPVRSDKESSKMILVMNVNANFLLQRLANLVDQRFITYLLNDNNEFLIHPRADVAFAHEFDGRTNLLSLYQLGQEMDSQFSTITAKRPDDKSNFYIDKNILFEQGTKRRSLILLLGMTTEQRAALIESRRSIQTTVIIIIVLVVIGVLIFFNLYIKRTWQLTRAQSEYKAIIDGTQDAIVSVSATTEVVTANNAALALFNISRDDIEDRFFDDLGLFGDFKLKNMIDEVVSRKQVVVADLKFQSSAGSKYLDLSASPVSLVKKVVNGVSIIFRDVTAQKEAEHKIHSINRSLEDQVKARTEELNRAKELAEATSDTKSSFISNVSHEMRTPLNGIIGSLELIRKESLSENQLSYLNLTDISITNLSNLVNDILDLSKIEAGKLEFRHESVDLTEVLEHTLALFQPLAAAKGIQLILNVAELDILQYYGDSYRVKQVLNNLLSNAVKFTAEGSIVVVARSKIVEQHITFTCSVSDTGMGIHHSKHAQIFDAFEQGGMNTSRTYGGSGLGLSITKQLCKLMDGHIEFVSARDEGSCFTFEISCDLGETLSIASAQRDVNLLGGVKFLLLLQDAQELAIVRDNIRSIGGDCVDSIDSVGAQAAIMQESNIQVPNVQVIMADDGYPNLQLIRQQYRSAMNGAIWVNYGHSGQRLLSEDMSDKLSLAKPYFNSQLYKLLAPYFANNEALQRMCAKLDAQRQIAKPDFSGIEKGRILVADDNEINLAILRGMLEETPFSVFTAKDGQEVIDFLNKTNKSNLTVDLLLLDCNMPVMDGFECTALIREGKAGENNKGLHIIAATADAMIGDRERCLAAGMDDYLAKPITREALFARIGAYWQDKA